jgi:hypothetical protein
MKVNVWVRKNDVKTFNITKGRHVGFWFRDPGYEDVVQVNISTDEFQYLLDQMELNDPQDDQGFGD